jgi:hypothetical protein
MTQQPAVDLDHPWPWPATACPSGTRAAALRQPSFLAAGRALYFSTEDEARAAELERPPETQAPDQEARQLLVGPAEFLDLSEPWLYAPR